MPKEVTYGANKTDQYVEVGWSRNPPGVTGVTVGAVNPKAGEIHDPATGWHVPLDRDGVNRLIRTLRRARDQAFGADA